MEGRGRSRILGRPAVPIFVLGIEESHIRSENNLSPCSQLNQILPKTK
jgi:hypothetical protein